MKTRTRSKWVVLIALVFLVLGAAICVEAACRKTVPQSIITYDPDNGPDCQDGKIKKVCTGTTCGNAASGQEGMTCCTPDLTTTSCSKYVGDVGYLGCSWDDAGIANGTTPSASLSGDECTG